MSKQELKALQKKIDSANKIILEQNDKINTERANLGALEDSIKERQCFLDELNYKASGVNDKLDILVVDIKKSEKVKEKLEQENEKVDHAIREGKKHLSGLEKETGEAEKELLRLSKERENVNVAIDNSQSQLKDLNKSFKEKKVLLSDVLKQIDDGSSHVKEINSELRATVNKIDEINLDISQKEEEIKRKDKFLSDLNDESVEVAKRVHASNVLLSALMRDIDQARDTLQEEKRLFENKCKEREEELEKREAKVSQQAQWTEEKRVMLREAKTEIEKHLNRPLEDIII